jgi:flagellar basal body-associated protein FliL
MESKMLNDEEECSIRRKKILHYFLIIGIPIIIIVTVIVVVVVVIKTKEKDNSENEPITPPESDPSWDYLIPIPSKEEMQELIKNAYNITT